MHAILRIIVVAAYAAYLAYDWFNVQHPEDRSKHGLYTIATGMITAATLLFIILSAKHLYGGSVVLLIISAAALFGMIVSLFFTLPKGTYVEPGKRRRTYKRKLYALCRHPGVLFYVLFYFFLWLAMPSVKGLIDCILLCAGNIIYMFVQDLWTFPHIFYDYDQYKRQTPMFLPTIKSMKRCMRYYRRG